jgi:hypothetical protein
MRFGWDFFKTWGGHMSGTASVPFYIWAVFADTKSQTLILGSLCYFSLVLSAFLFWLRSSRLEAKSAPQLRVAFEDTIVGFVDRSRSRCIRLEVENIGRTRLNKCEGWLQTIKEMPRLSPAKLFWVGMPEEGSVDLTKGISRRVQVFRLHESNRIIPATFGVPPEQFPVDLINTFAVGTTYHFRVGLKGEDEAETVFRTIELVWNGDWQTAKVNYVEG